RLKTPRKTAPAGDADRPAPATNARTGRSGNCAVCLRRGDQAPSRPAGETYSLAEVELPDELLELIGGPGEVGRGGGHLLGRGTGLLGRGADLLGGGAGLLGHAGDLGDAVLHPLAGRRDVLDRRGDELHAIAHVGDRLADALKGLAGVLHRLGALLGLAGTGLAHLDGPARLALDLVDEVGDGAGRGLGLLGQLADLLGHDGKALAL